MSASYKLQPLAGPGSEGFFYGLSASERNEFDRILSFTVAPARTVLFAQQESANGFFVICEGDVKLYVTSPTGRTLTLRFAFPGDPVGLWAALSNARYEATAETLGTCRVAFIANEAFRRCGERCPALIQRALHSVRLQYNATCERLASIGLASSTLEMIANFLLDWSARHGIQDNNTRFEVPFSHEELAEHLGITRESVTRGMCELKRRALISSDGKALAIPDRRALRCIQKRGATRLTVAERRVAHRNG